MGLLLGAIGDPCVQEVGCSRFLLGGFKENWKALVAVVRLWYSSTGKQAGLGSPFGVLIDMKRERAIEGEEGEGGGAGDRQAKPLTTAWMDLTSRRTFINGHGGSGRHTCPLQFLRTGPWQRVAPSDDQPPGAARTASNLPDA